MTRTVRFTGRFMNDDEETADIVCDAATATVPPSRRQIGASGDVQLSMMPTAITLYDVEEDSLAALRRGTWTHISWAAEAGTASRELAVGPISIDGTTVRVIV